MYGTTFPNPEGGFGGYSSPEQGQRQQEQQVDQQHQSAQQPSSQGQGYQKKPWEGQAKKPWDGQKKAGGGGGFTRPVETDMTIYKPYAVTGNRDMPAHLVTKMIELVKKLEGLGYTLRTGGLEGIEEAVENAAMIETKKEVILPFRDFNQKKSKFTYVSDRAHAVAKLFFPSYDTIKKGAQLFLAKNARLVMGNNMVSPALFLLCWTEDGVEAARDRTMRTGFTGHPIAIASTIGIPVFNLGNPSAEQRLSLYLESLPHE